MNIKKVKKNELDAYVRSDHQKKKKQKMKQNKNRVSNEELLTYGKEKNNTEIEIKRKKGKKIGQYEKQRKKWKTR